MSRKTAIWALAALLGIVVTAAITWATSQLTSQRIGLASEPLSAGSGLAPGAETKSAVTRTATRRRRRGGAHSSATATVTTTATYSAVAPPAPSPSEPAPSAPQSPAREASESAPSHQRSRDDGGEGGGPRGRDD